MYSLFHAKAKFKMYTGHNSKTQKELKEALLCFLKRYSEDVKDKGMSIKYLASLPPKKLCKIAGFKILKH